MRKSLTTRQQFALHCLNTDTLRSGATYSARVAKRSGVYTTSQAREALDALVSRGLATKHRSAVDGVLYVAT